MKLKFIIGRLALCIIAVGHVAYIGFWIALALTYGKDAHTIKQFIAGFALFGVPIMTGIILAVVSARDYQKRFRQTL